MIYHFERVGFPLWLRSFYLTAILLGSYIFYTVIAESSFAQLPSSADPARVRLPAEATPPAPPPRKINLEGAPDGVSAPQNAKNIHVRVDRVVLKGVTAFSSDELSKTFSSLLGKDATLEVVWEIAARITKAYRDSRYFLSRAYVPAQEITGNTIEIHVVEGYFGRLELDDPTFNTRPLLRHWQLLTQQRPVRTTDLENFMLRVNNLPGGQYRALVQGYDHQEEGAVQLTLTRTEEPTTLFFNFDVYGSRFQGPARGMITYIDSFLPMHETSFSVLLAAPLKELRFGSISHRVAIDRDFELQISASEVISEPGHSLKDNEILSSSTSFGLGVRYSPVVSLAHDLKFSLDFDLKNVSSSVLGVSTQTRDRLRVLRAGIAYQDRTDPRANNEFKLTVNQGLNIFGATLNGSDNISRSDGSAEFTSLQMDLTRQHLITNDLLAIGRVSGQYALSPVLSNEEFGYGGQSFGRAYDPSEITGDSGLSGSLEVRYLGVPPSNKFNIVPYAFYDAGQVWQRGNEEEDEYAASSGFGIRLARTNNVTANVGIAFPLVRKVDNPIFSNDEGPRYLLQLGFGL